MGKLTRRSFFSGLVGVGVVAAIKGVAPKQVENSHHSRRVLAWLSDEELANASVAGIALTPLGLLHHLYDLPSGVVIAASQYKIRSATTEYCLVHPAFPIKRPAEEAFFLTRKEAFCR